jgi:hypothetical protein
VVFRSVNDFLPHALWLLFGDKCTCSKACRLESRAKRGVTPDCSKRGSRNQRSPSLEDKNSEDESESKSSNCRPRKLRRVVYDSDLEEE